MRFKDSMRFVEEEGTASSFEGMAEVIERRWLPSSLYTDHGRGTVERDNPEPYPTTASP